MTRRLLAVAALALLLLLTVGQAGAVGAATTQYGSPVDEHTAASPTQESGPMTIAGNSDSVGLDPVEPTINVTEHSSVAASQVVPVIDSLVDRVPDVGPLVVLAPAGYSRHDDSDPLTHETRREIYEQVTASPGTYVSEIATATDTPLSTVRYHVRVLEAEDLVREQRLTGKRRLFPTRSTDVAVHAALNDDPTATIVDAIDRLDRPTVSTLAEETERSDSTVSYHLSRLEESGVVARERNGNRVHVTLPSGVEAAVTRLSKST
jgi:predicted transcriptional regulator